MAAVSNNYEISEVHKMKLEISIAMCLVIIQSVHIKSTFTLLVTAMFFPFKS